MTTDSCIEIRKIYSIIYLSDFIQKSKGKFGGIPAEFQGQNITRVTEIGLIRSDR